MSPVWKVTKLAVVRRTYRTQLTRRWLALLFAAPSVALSADPVIDKPSVLSEFLSDVGAEKVEVTYLGQKRSAFGADGATTVLSLMPAGAVYFDRDRSKAEKKLCVTFEVDSEGYRKTFSGSVSAGTSLIIAKAQSLTLHLAPVDEAEPPYSWVQPRTDHAAGPLGAEFKTCFDIGAGREPEAVAAASMVRAYFTTPALQGVVSSCAATLSLKEVEQRVADAQSVTTAGNGPNVLITGAQLNHLLSTNAVDIDISCAGASADAVKIVRDQIGNVMPTILGRLQTFDATWDQLKGNMWSLGFSTQAETVIDKLKKHTTKTESTKNLDVKANDFAGFGITGSDGQKITDENENSETTKVTVPASIKVYRLAKNNKVFSTSVSARELYVSGKTAATMLLRSRFVEDGVIRTVKQISLTQFPPGAIVAWFGNQAKDLPPGWGFCDGGEYVGAAGVKVKTPDLRGRFLREAGGNLGAVGGQESIATQFTQTLAPAPFVSPVGPATSYCVKENKNTNQCMESKSNPSYLTNVTVAMSLPTVPPYMNVAFICKLP